MNFLAAVLVEHNKPLELERLKIVHSLAAGQVFVEVKNSGVCGAQLCEISGVKGHDAYMPHLLGHEGAGIVQEIGPGVTQVKPGDHVVMHWRRGEGIQSAPPKYQNGTITVGAGWVTTFNEMAVVSENRLTKMDKRIPFDIAALMGCAVTTGLGLIAREAKLEIGQSVAVFGCGGVGLNVIQAASIAGAYPILGIDIHSKKCRMAEQFGATLTTSTDRTIDDLMPQGVDIVVDTTGIPSVIERAFQITARGGRLYLVAQTPHNQEIRLQPLAFHSGKHIIASDGGSTNPTVDIPRYLRLYNSGRLKLDQLITHRVPLAEVNSLLDEIRAGKVGRGLLTMGN